VKLDVGTLEKAEASCEELDVGSLYIKAEA
jgi:hypothetical protein